MPYTLDRYRIMQPLDTHTKIVTCDAFGCSYYLQGWITTIDTTTDLGREQYQYITGDKSRTHTQNGCYGGMVEFQFEAGQQCFATHRVGIDRPAFYRISNLSVGSRSRHHIGTRTVTCDEWVDRFAENQDRLSTLIERG